MNPIVRRELVELLRTRGALAAQIALAAACILLVLVRWPTGGVSDLNGARSMQVLRVFGYGLLAGILFLVPAYPASAIVRERVRGTLALLLNSPMSATSIYLGKLGGILGFAALLLTMTLPAAGACYALGGVPVSGGIGLLYAILGLAVLQLATLGLLVSSRADSVDTSLRLTYSLVLAVAVLPLVPYALFEGKAGGLGELVSWIRCLSPIPAVLEVIGQSGRGAHGMDAGTDVIGRYAILALGTSWVCAMATIARLSSAPLDRSRPAGVMTDDLSIGTRAARRMFFLVDPNRRSRNISLIVNPVMAKEFRTRRFGRSHWTLRLIALSALLSLALSCIAAAGALEWGHEEIAGGLVILQTILLLLFAPSLSAGLISSEREGGSWQLLRTTPLSAGTILRGKLASAIFPLLLLLCATMPGYLVMIAIDPQLSPQAQRVAVCLVVMALFAVLVGAAASSLFRSTASATVAAYLVLVGICVAPLLAWLGRDAPFGRGTVESVLSISPLAAALHASQTRGFAEYELLPVNWWVMGAMCLGLIVLLVVRTRRLYRPE
ncbi:MAG TPA: ABC transporter permease [Gemmataceae bacterium]|jgi:ABC-type transport system involved in multi-copper enzyme maturation permease subunit|nr:ABC transporter permease [Gemmataceae bacterium]